MYEFIERFMTDMHVFINTLTGGFFLLICTAVFVGLIIVEMKGRK